MQSKLIVGDASNWQLRIGRLRLGKPSAKQQERINQYITQRSAEIDAKHAVMLAEKMAQSGGGSSGSSDKVHNASKREMLYYAIGVVVVLVVLYMVAKKFGVINK